MKVRKMIEVLQALQRRGFGDTFVQIEHSLESDRTVVVPLLHVRVEGKKIILSTKDQP